MAEVLFVGKLFLGLVHAAAHDGLVKVYQMAVKVRAVHAGELGLAVYGKAVPSIIMVFMETVVLMPYSLVRLHTARIMGIGPRTNTSS